AWVLKANYRFFPKGTVFLCVADPGVGSKRQAVAVQTENYFFVGPDNGLMYPAASEDGVRKTVRLSAEDASHTFHGRDVFAPAAARLEMLTAGMLGEDTALQTRLEFCLKGRTGEVVRIDSFGNVITNIPSLGKKMYDVVIEGKAKKIPYYIIYDEAPENEMFLIVGSASTLELSVRNKSANRILGLKAGQRIEIR
ncbi:MAG: SAM-dependent chlorinase/fluorinase, partial [archaeon]